MFLALDFPSSGGRIGQGAGFYDRFLRLYESFHGVEIAPTLLGVGLKEQLVDDEEMENVMHAADKRLDYLVLGGEDSDLIDCKAVGNIVRWTKAL